MTVTLELSPEREAVLKAEAQLRGLTLEQWSARSSRAANHPASVAHLQRTNPQEWARYFDADSHDPNLPVLSDEAMSRESMLSGPRLTHALAQTNS